MRSIPLKKSVIAGVLVLALMIPATGSAATTMSATSATCLTKAGMVFSPWGDLTSYALAPGGSFEGTSGWSLVSASPVAGNEPWHIRSAKDSTSLSINAGGSATSPLFCGTLATPTVRFFVRSASVTAKLQVDVLYPSFDGTVKSLTIGTVAGTTTWAPTNAMLLLVNLLAFASPTGQVDLAVRVTATSGTWQVDDVYVDPFRKG